MNLALFLAATILITLLLIAALGDWLLPQMGVQGAGQTMIPGAISGVLIVMLHGQMFRTTNS